MLSRPPRQTLSEYDYAYVNDTHKTAAAEQQGPTCLCSRLHLSPAQAPAITALQYRPPLTVLLPLQLREHSRYTRAVVCKCGRLPTAGLQGKQQLKQTQNHMPLQPQLRPPKDAPRTSICMHARRQCHVFLLQGPQTSWQPLHL
jgi:hypothetical protein